MRSPFGWSLPPGCTTLPGEEPVGPCECCGGHCESDKTPCICPECPECTVAGDPKCYREHGLIYSFSQLRGQAWLVEAIRIDNEREAAYWQQYQDDMEVA